MKELQGIHTPESETYGFWSFVYKARRPFNPMRLYALLNGRWDGVIRAKGFFWLASRMNLAGSVSQAGGMLRHEAAGAWWAAVKPLCRSTRPLARCSRICATLTQPTWTRR